MEGVFSGGAADFPEVAGAGRGSSSSDASGEDGLIEGLAAGQRRGDEFGAESGSAALRPVRSYQRNHAGISDTCEALTEEEVCSLDAVLGHQIAENTRKSYENQWRRFVRWAGEREVRAIPADPVHVALYLAECVETQGHRPATLRTAAAAVSYAHKSVDLADPCATRRVRDVLRSAARKAGGMQRQAEALTARRFRRIRATALRRRRGRGGYLESEKAAESRGVTDIAIVSLMRDAMLRVSEAAALTWDDLTYESDGTGRLLIRRSKTDVEGESAVLFVSAQTMSHMAEMRSIAGDRTSVFGLGADQISRRIKRAALAAGLGEGFSGHSPRVGMAQDLARAGTELPRLMTAGRWRSPRMPALYIRNETAARGAVAQYYGTKDDPCVDAPSHRPIAGNGAEAVP